MPKFKSHGGSNMLKNALFGLVNALMHFETRMKSSIFGVQTVKGQGQNMTEGPAGVGIQSSSARQCASSSNVRPVSVVEILRAITLPIFKKIHYFNITGKNVTIGQR